MKRKLSPFFTQPVQKLRTVLAGERSCSALVVLARRLAPMDVAGQLSGSQLGLGFSRMHDSNLVAVFATKAQESMAATGIHLNTRTKDSERSR